MSYGMFESKEFKTILVFLLTVIILEGDSKMPRIRPEKKSEPRDYRPTKWLTNSAMDIWYGNKSMVDILSREFFDVMDKIARRPVRRVSEYEKSTLNVTKLPSPEELTRLILLDKVNSTISRLIYKRTP